MGTIFTQQFHYIRIYILEKSLPAKGDINKNAYCITVYNSKKNENNLSSTEWVNVQYTHHTIQINGQAQDFR